jgi:hypothetical protein
MLSFLRETMKKPAPRDLSLTERIVSAALGVFVGIYGYGQILRGRIIYKNRQGLDMPALFVIILGGLFLLAAVFPWAWLHFLWDDGKKRKRLH